ncbi:MAG: hypothetical protein IIA75_07655, partial [Proteobacteria bacterium]|nr:hypothetical protein [Pseudomonadota bacterium]
MTATSQLRLVIASLCSFFIVLLPFLHVYANNVTNVQLPMSEFVSDLFWLSFLCFISVCALLRLLPAKFQSYAIIFLGILNVTLWLQINFFIGHYGYLDGGEPGWESNFMLGVIQLISFAFIILLFIKFRKLVIDNFIFGAAILVISSLVYVPQLLEAANKPKHKKYTFTKKGIYEFSSERNVIIFVIDSLQADVVNEIFHETPTLTESFSGFTFFRNSLSSFPKTYASIPALLSGRPFDNTQTLSDYLESAYIFESLPAYLKKEDFDVRHWSSSPQSLLAHPFVSDNIVNNKGQAISTISIEDKELITNMVLFRLAPHFLKPWIYNHGEFRINLGELGLTLDNKQHICHLRNAERDYSRGFKSFDTVFLDEFELCST